MSPSATSALQPALRDLMRALALVVLCMLAVHLLAGCGAGDPEPDHPTPSVNCALQPAVCK